MLVATEHLLERLATEGTRRHSRGKKSLFGLLLASERVIHARHADAVGFDGAHQRLERRRLGVYIARANEDAVTTGLNREHSRFRYLIVVCKRFHLEIVAQNHTLVLQLAAQ